MFHRQFGASCLLDAVGIEPVSWFSQFSTAFNEPDRSLAELPFAMVVTLQGTGRHPRDLGCGLARRGERMAAVPT